MEKRILTGKKEISFHTGRSWPTVREWINTKKFPARKLDGVWTSSMELIDFWVTDQIKIAERSTK